MSWGLAQSKGVFLKIMVVSRLEFDPKAERVTAVLPRVRSAFGISSFVLPLESSVLHSPITAVVAMQGLVSVSSYPWAAAPVHVHF